MKLLTSKGFSSSGSWTAPAGVTSVILTGPFGAGTSVAVVPATTYTVVIGSIGTLTPTSFGSLYQLALPSPFDSAPYNLVPLTVTWQEI